MAQEDRHEGEGKRQTRENPHRLLKDADSLFEKRPRHGSGEKREDKKKEMQKGNPPHFNLCVLCVPLSLSGETFSVSGRGCLP